MLHAIAPFVAILSSAFVGWANLHTDEPTVVLAFALPAVFVASVMRPPAALPSGLIVGAAIPASTLLAFWLGWRVPYPCSLATLWQSCVVFAFTLPVAGIGYVVSKMLFPPVTAQ